MKTLLCIAVLALSGCASTSDFFGPRVLSAGESYCTGTPAQCAELQKVVASLNTPEVTAALQRAQCQAQRELCK